MAENTDSSAQSGTKDVIEGKVVTPAPTDQISIATLNRLAEQAGGDAGALVDAVRAENARKNQQ